MVAAVNRTQALATGFPDFRSERGLSAEGLQEEPRSPMTLAFGLFLILNAVLFIRFAEIITALDSWPIYQTVIIACLLCSIPKILSRLRFSALRSQPVTVCVLALAILAPLSLLVHLKFFDMWEEGADFFKVICYYLLLVALVDTRERLRQFLGWLTVFVLALTALALCQYHGWINISALAPYAEAQDRIDPSGSAVVVVRLVSTGIFNDPNDLSLILIFGALASFYFFEDRRANPLNYLWIGCAATFLYAISLTYSRGGFIALMSALLTLFTARFGWRKSLILSAVVVPAALIYFGGTRQTDISVAQGTGHQRVWLWSEGLRLIRGTDALLGIGKGQYVEEVSYVAHNSFIHCYVELGLLGGTIFFAAFFSTLVALARVTSKSVRAATPHMQRLAPYLLAITVAYATGYMTLSRSYSLTTYLIFGLSTAYVTVAGLRPIMRDWRVDWSFVRRSMAGSFALFCALYLFVKIAMSAS